MSAILLSTLANYEEPLEMTTTSVLLRSIPWETYMTARLITEKDLEAIRQFDKRPKEVQDQVIKEAGPAVIESFLNVLRNVTKDETVQYVLAVLDHLLKEDDANAKLFHQLGPGAPDPYSILLRLLQRADWFTQEKACLLLTAVLEARPSIDEPNPDSPAAQTLVAFLDWLCNQLRRPSNPNKSVPIGVLALARLLKEREVRVQFFKAGGVTLLAPLLKSVSSASNVQLLYETALCLWQVSYYPPAADAIVTSGTLPGLVDIVKVVQKEKAVRVALLTLRNLLTLLPEARAAEPLVDLGLQKVVLLRLLDNYEDEDVPELLKWMEMNLEASIVLMSSFEKYKKEVLEGTLDWTPMHKQDTFWKDNLDHFEDKDFQILRVLLNLLQASRESKILSVACHDLGQFITHHPHGRNIVSDLHGKEFVMRLMTHPDPAVRKEALRTTQKMLLPKDKLDYMSKLGV